MSDLESQEDEIEALQSIFTEEEFHSLKNNNIIEGEFNAFVSLPDGYTISYGRKEVISEDDNSVDANSGDTKRPDNTKKFQKSVIIQHLPPIQLCFRLPGDYPSKSPPIITISCPWLTFVQLLKLSRKLYKIWAGNKGFVVLYSWAQFLKDECLVFLHLEKSLDISAVEDASSRGKLGPKKYGKKGAPPDSSCEVEKIAEKELVNENPIQEEAKEECSVLDLSSISEELKEEQAQLIKLSLYDLIPSTSNKKEECEASLIRKSLYESGPSEEESISRMIAFDQPFDVKRSLYCTSDDEVEPKVEENARRLSKAGPSCTKSANQGKAGRFCPKLGRDSKPKTKKISASSRFRVQETHLAEPLWNVIVDYDKLRRKKDFDYQMFSCAVCFEEKIGSQCMELDSCNHVFCRDCLTSFLNVFITEGKVRQLTCPETDCNMELLQSEIKSLVSPELFARYDSILLATTLDTLNVTYCPRKFCQYPVSPDNETMAVCPQCRYCFCPFCKMVYHGVEECRFKLDSEETKALIKEYGSCSESRKAELEKRYGRKHLQTLVDKSLTESWISTNSKQCPKCNTSIERSYGCNKMVCLRCSTAFCWLCFEVLNSGNPYNHFQTGRCQGKLYFGMEMGEVEEIDEIDVDDEFDDDEFFDEYLGFEGIDMLRNDVIYFV